jgi:hypothetical protein
MMATKKEKPEPKSKRTRWLDEKESAQQIQSSAQRLSTFLDAIADGKIEKKELKDQEARVVALMKKIEPELDDALHDEVTQLLCEMTAYNIMHTVHDLAAARPLTKFRG